MLSRRARTALVALISRVLTQPLLEHLAGEADVPAYA